MAWSLTSSSYCEFSSSTPLVRITVGAPWRRPARVRRMLSTTRMRLAPSPSARWRSAQGRIWAAMAEATSALAAALKVAAAGVRDAGGAARAGVLAGAALAGARLTGGVGWARGAGVGTIEGIGGGGAMAGA